MATKNVVSVCILLIVSMILLHGSKPIYAQESISISLPPASLAQWYKPQNKRQVWLHLMFRLGQTSQALSTYANEGNVERSTHWAKQLAASYRKIPDMVPEWRTEVDVAALDALDKAINRRDISKIQAAMKPIRQSCKSCHGQFKATSILLYRSSDFSQVRIQSGQEVSHNYRTFMRALRHDLNSLKIAREESHPDKARHYGVQLKNKLLQLGESCQSCHRDPEPKARILGDHTFQIMDKLLEALKEPGKTKKSGQQLGALGFSVCGRCHGIHRNVMAIKRLLP